LKDRSKNAAASGDNAPMSLIMPDEFDAAFALLEEAFPPEERGDRAYQRGLLSREAYNLWGWYDSGLLKGVIALWEFEAFIFIEHFTVAADGRGAGTGARILNWLKTRADSRCIILEVEAPDTRDAKRRIAFYRRNGFERTTYRYIQPRSRAADLPVALQIMSWPAVPSARQFRRMQETYLPQVYAPCPWQEALWHVTD
jgi:GNAT superfamily N-acetyltransferase